MLDLLPDTARISLFVVTGLYAGFWLFILAYAGVDSLRRRLTMRR